MFEECDSHELNIFLQDKLISLVPKSVRKYLKRQGFKSSEKLSKMIKLTDSSMSDLNSPRYDSLSFSETLDDE
jgi:hypothetical protein